MSKSLGRVRGDAEITRLLDSPQLPQVVPQLAPETLHHLIHHHGLEACGELVAYATPEQLTAVFDLDLWRSAQPGLDARFDAERFGEWVELLVDTGDSVAARIVASMDVNLFIAGLSHHVRIFDPGIFEPTAQSGDEAPDIKVVDLPSTGLSCEVGGYIVYASTAEAWDAIVALLIALEIEQPECFHAVMTGCRRISNDGREIDGLDDLLEEPEQLLHNVAIEREERRSQQGYATPSEARAFLQAARMPADRRPPLAWIREAAESTPHDNGDTGDSGEHVARMRELVFLANVLVAGCSIQSRAFTPQEATAAVLAICRLGIEPRLVNAPAASTTSSTAILDLSMPFDPDLLEHDLVDAFAAGWATLYADVSLFVTDRLIAMLSEMQHLDVFIQDGLGALRRELAKQRAAGTPWHAREALEVIALLDMAAWTSLLGLLDECPVVPAALTAIVQGQTTPISPRAFELISTRRHIAEIHTFIERLPDVLLG